MLRNYRRSKIRGNTMIFNWFKNKSVPPRYFKTYSFINKFEVWFKVENNCLFSWDATNKCWYLEEKQCGKKAIRTLTKDKDAEEVSAEEFEWRIIE